MNLEKIILSLGYKNVTGEKNREVEDITFDSRKAKENVAFVAIKGFSTDGHKFITKAIENGCNVVFYDDPTISMVEGVSYIKVENSRDALADIAKVVYGDPTSKLDLFGVTGTNGKTTVTFMVEGILNGAGIDTASIGTIGIKIKDRIIGTEHTTPESNELQKIYDDFLKQGIKASVMEASSHALELKRVRGIEFDYGIFTNLTIEHQDLHGSMENYYQAKKSLFHLTSKANIINVDDPYGQRLAEELVKEGRKAITYGIEKHCDYKGENIHLETDTATFDMVCDKGRYQVKLPISGEFNVYNGLAALAATIEWGLAPEIAVENIAKFKSPEGRFQVIENDFGIKLIIDFAHTPDALEKLLSFTRKTVGEGRIIIVYSLNHQRTEEIRIQMGEIAGKYADLSVITTDDPNYESPAEIAKVIAKGIESQNGKHTFVEKREEAVAYAVKIAQPGDVVYFLGKGHEDYLLIEGKKVHYCEYDAVQNAIKNR